MSPTNNDDNDDWTRCQMSPKVDIENYPDIVTVSSKGAAKIQWSKLGVYKKMCGVTRNDKPVWKMRGVDEYIFYDGN